MILVTDWLDDHGILDERGNPRPAANYLERLEVRAANARARLGLDPLSLAKLLGTLTATAVASGDDQALEQLRAEGARIIALREAAANGTGSVPALAALASGAPGMGDGGAGPVARRGGAYRAPPAAAEDGSER